MKIIILLFFCATTIAQNLPEAKPLEAPTTKQDLKINHQKRQTPSSYTSSIAHGTSEDGKEAHSSVSVNFGDKDPNISVQKFHKPQISFKQNIQQQQQQKKIQNTQLPKRQSGHQNVQILEEVHLEANQNNQQPQINLYPTPKTILDYIKHEIPTTPESTKEDYVTTAPSLENSNLLAPLLVQNQAPLFSHPHHNYRQLHPQSFRHREKNPQLFNVGYSINIMNHEPNLQFRLPKPQPNFRPGQVRGDIITGSHKDTVGKPSELNIVESNLPHPNLHLLQGPTEINYPVKVFPTSYVDVNSNPANLPQPKEGYVWKNLGPGVEISSYLSQEDQLQAQNFDHEGALGKSEPFDSSNALDPEPIGINSKQSFQDFKTNLHDGKSPQENLYEKLYKNNPIFYKNEPQVSVPNPIKVELFKPKPTISDLTVFPQNFDQKLVIPTPHDQNFLKFAPQNPDFLKNKYTNPQYQIHENINEGLPIQAGIPKNFYRHGRFFTGPQGPPGPRSFLPYQQPYRYRFARDGHVQYLRPPPVIYRMPKYLQ